MNCLERKEQMNFFSSCTAADDCGKEPGGKPEKGLAFCRQAGNKWSADLALFPEMWNNSYSVNPDVEKLKQGAVSMAAPFCTGFPSSGS